MSEAFARRYRLLDRIAIGGTAEVFRAQFVADDGERPVVIKRVLPQFARDERFRRLFLEEACVAVTLEHPNVVRVLDHGEIGQTCFIALEPVDGQDLGTLLSQARARGEQTVDSGLAALIAAQVAEALQFIHDHTSSEGTPLRIIHRDVSPQNILVSHQGDVKLTDFGIAKSAIRQESTVDGTLRGKLDYMAPEQATATVEIDHRADIFGLGCVLYEMVAGTPPFRGSREIETLDRLRQGAMCLPPEHLEVPPRLRAVLARALALDPADRYQQAGEMATDLYSFTETLSPRPTDAALAAWVQAQPPAAKPANAVDDAVRMLLGDGGADHGSAPRTSIFAATPSTAAGALDTTAEVQRPPERRIPWAIVLPLSMLAISGWLFWAVDRATAPSESPAKAVPAPLPRAAGAARLDAGPAPSVREPNGYLDLRSHPTHAAVLVNGIFVGETPQRLPLPDHAIKLEVKRAGFRPWHGRVEPDGSPQHLELTLAPLPQTRRSAKVARRHKRTGGSGYLTVNSLPWSRVYLDGKFVGNTPVVRIEVPAGPRRVQLRAPGGKLRRSFVALVPRGETRAFTFDLTD